MQADESKGRQIRRLFETQKPEVEKVARTGVGIGAERISNIEGAYPESQPVLRLGEKRFLHRGDVGVIFAKSNAGKSHVMESIVASMMACVHSLDAIDTLGFEGVNLTSTDMVLYIDTERSHHLCQHGLFRIQKRSGWDGHPMKDQPMPNLYMLSLIKQYKSLTKLNEVRQAMGRLAPTVVIIDGVTDILPCSVNDENGVDVFMEELMEWATEQQIAILVTIHENPTADSKPRGVMGSELWRKAASMMRIRYVSKELDEEDDYRVLTTKGTMYSKIRDGHDRMEQAFGWDDATGMFTTRELDGERLAPKKASAKAKGGVLVRDAMKQILETSGAMSIEVLQERVCQIVKRDIALKTITNRVREFKKAGLLVEYRAQKQTDGTMARIVGRTSAQKMAFVEPSENHFDGMYPTDKNETGS